MCTHDLCFRAKLRKNHNFSSEKNHFYIPEILQFIVWPCYCNEIFTIMNMYYAHVNLNLFGDFLLLISIRT